MMRYLLATGALAFGLLAGGSDYIQTAAANESATGTQTSSQNPHAPAAGGTDPATEKNWALLNTYCTECHNFEDWAGGVAFDSMVPEEIPQEAKIWEATIRKLRGRMMPPPGEPRPDQASVDEFVRWMEAKLDAAAAAHPDPGYVVLHRLNRREYQRAIEDLLGITIDATALLPKDIESDGFDNVANVLKVTPSFLDQYINAAREVSVLAIGDPNASKASKVYRASGNDQGRHIEGLPLGTRGGMLIEHFFPADGEYEFNLNMISGVGYITGLDHEHKVIMTIDGRKVFEEKIGGSEELKAADQRAQETAKAIRERFSNIRVPVKAGPHRIGVTFVARTFAESDAPLQPLNPAEGMDRIPRVGGLEIVGPHNPTGVSETPSRKRIFVCQPKTAEEELPCARQIVTHLATRAYRRPVTEADLEAPVRFYRTARESGGSFDVGIQNALTAILASPKFLYRAEPVPADAKPGSIYRVGEIELASRLSFFLWSQGPDKTLLDLAAAGKLSDPQVLEQQVRRMLADPRARSLVTNFAYQWLQVDEIDDIDPDPALYPEFDEELREAFRREMELFVESILLENRSVVDLLTADYTFVNERLALHYGIPNVRGDRFRRVKLDNSARWGLLGKGAVLMGTSYGNRTAPVLRGAWILENITGTPPSAPPPGVEALKENTAGAKPTTVRERLELHRENPSCNSCHGVMDPLGFALENFDAIGGWRQRDREALEVIDSSGELPDGSKFAGPDDLRKILTERPEQFVQTMTEKLMTFALGRTVEYHDMPAIRAIVREAAKDDYRFASIVLGIVKSDAFRMKRLPAPNQPDTKQAAVRH